MIIMNVVACGVSELKALNKKSNIDNSSTLCLFLLTSPVFNTKDLIPVHIDQLLFNYCDD